MNPKHFSIVWFLLRFGVAFTFLFASISAFLNPTPWLSYFPDFMRAQFSDQLLLMLWGGGELVIGIWLLTGWRIFVPSVAAALLLIGIFIFDFHSIKITFRNVSILSTSIALAIISFPHSQFTFVHDNKKSLEVHTLNK